MQIRYLLLLSAVFLATTMNAQLSYFVEAGGNLSILPKVRNSNAYMAMVGSTPIAVSADVRSSYEKKPGFQFKGGIQIPLSGKFFLEPAINLHYIKLRKKTEMKYNVRSQPNYSDLNNESINAAGSSSDYGDPLFIPGAIVPFPTSYITAPDAENIGKTSFTFLSLDMNAKYIIAKHTNIAIGITPYTMLNTYRYRYELTPLPSQTQYQYRAYPKKDQTKDSYNNTGIAAGIYIEQGLTKNMSLLAGGTQYISRLYSRDAAMFPDKKTRIRYLSLGVRYYFN
jgi:hypothetical protein